MRIFAVRLISVCFIILGLWDIFLFIQGMWKGSAELTYLVIGIILFRTGDNLFFYKEIGRKLALAILGINILQIIVVSFLAIFYKNFTYSLTVLGTSFHSDGLLLFMALVIPWLSIDVLLILLLLQEKTRLVFHKK